MRKLLALLIIFLPVAVAAQYSGLKFSVTTLNVTVTAGQYVNLQQIKVLKTDGSAAPSTMKSGSRGQGTLPAGYTDGRYTPGIAGRIQQACVQR